MRLTGIMSTIICKFFVSYVTPSPRIIFLIYTIYSGSSQDIGYNISGAANIRIIRKILYGSHFSQVLITPEKDMFGRKPEKTDIDSFTNILIRESHMRGTYEYEVSATDKNFADISFYSVRYDGKEDKRIPEGSARIPVDEMLKILNDFNIFSWDGFKGKHPRGVLDGTMFRFEAAVNEDCKITAEGSENFPDHYKDLIRFLCEKLRNKD